MRIALHLGVLVATLLVCCARAAPPADLKSLADSEYPDLERLYTTIHQAPELSLGEEKTSARLAEELRRAGFEVSERVGGFGVVAVLKNGAGKTLLIRSDLDALPVTEETGAPYASTVKAKNAVGDSVGVMHACGHDIHITCLVGVARAMATLKSQWKGTLILIGQPAEEVVKGASAMIEDGLFTRFPRPDYCLALHVDSELEVGKVGYVSGYAFAAVDSVDLVIHGVGGHGAMPHTTKDPIAMAAEMILIFQTIASRETKATDPVVVTVGSIHGGTKHNIIPDEVKLQLTVRTYKEEVRQKTLKSIARIAKGIAEAAGVPDDRLPTMTLTAESTPATYNTPELVERVVGVFRRTLGDENVVQREPTMGAEDFGRFGTVEGKGGEPKIPIFMFRLGSVAPQRVADSKRDGGKPLPSLHSSKYLPEREAIKTGVTAMTAAAVDLLK
jgi:hippurate hydrolase